MVNGELRQWQLLFIKVRIEVARYLMWIYNAKWVLCITQPFRKLILTKKNSFILSSESEDFYLWNIIIPMPKFIRAQIYLNKSYKNRPIPDLGRKLI